MCFYTKSLKNYPDKNPLRMSSYVKFKNKIKFKKKKKE